MIKFASSQKLEVMNDYPFGLKVSSTVIKIAKWSPAVVAFYKLFSIWVEHMGCLRTFSTKMVLQMLDL